MKIRESQFSGGTMIYIDWQGPLKNIRQPFDKIMGDLDKYRKGVESMGQKAPTSKETPCLGIYYDDPYNLQDPNQFRAACGFLILPWAPFK